MNDPLKQVTYENDDLKIFTPARKRVGRPRTKWINLTEKDAFKIITDAPYFRTPAQVLLLKNCAISRIEPFSTK